MSALTARQQHYTLTISEAARCLGISRNHAYALIQRREFPCKVLPLGRALRVPASDLARVLDVPVEELIRKEGSEETVNRTP